MIMARSRFRWGASDALPEGALGGVVFVDAGPARVVPRAGADAVELAEAGGSEGGA